MHVNSIVVQDEDVEFTEKILLGEGKKFDESRRNYIKDFSTLDLQAVPGSGKTTLLLAKLLILEKNLPFDDNTGILVISHTNTAVNEIMTKIKVYCPKLFSYPNFVGTIQGFVNKYLALPFYEKTYNKKIKRMNDEIYYECIEKYFSSIQNYKLKAWLNRQYDPIEILKGIRFNEDDNLITGINGTEEKFILKDKSGTSYKGLKRMKEAFVEAGILHYDDAYYLAMKYIKENPKIIKLLQKRFRYIFVDEMQDMGIHQYRILEEIFANHDTATTAFQRIGDNNQAIYGKEVNFDTIWKSRSKVHTISGSNRLTRINAKLASRFSIDNSFIEGLNTVDKIYKPVLLVYNQDKVECSVIKRFSQYLNELFEKDESYSDINYNVVSWRRHHKNSDKIALSSYCPKNVNISGNNENSGVLQNKSFDYYKVNKVIIDKIVEKLDQIGVKIDKRDITKSLLINHLKELGDREYDKYKSCIYKCINSISNENYEGFLQEINSYLERLTKFFNYTDNKVNLLTFEEKDFEFIGGSSNQDKKCNECDVMGSSPIVNSVHSVKGETHDVTLFLESFYNRKYESDILHEVLCGKTVFASIQEDLQQVKDLADEIISIEAKGKERGIKTRKDKIKKIKSRIKNKRQYSRLVYVALTRAKSIVGYGVSRENYNNYLRNNINLEEWEVILVE